MKVPYPRMTIESMSLPIITVRQNVFMQSILLVVIDIVIIVVSGFF